MGLIAAVCTMYGSEQSFDHDHVIGIFSMFTTGHLDFVKGFIEYWVDFLLYRLISKWIYNISEQKVCNWKN